MFSALFLGENSTDGRGDERLGKRSAIKMLREKLDRARISMAFCSAYKPAKLRVVISCVYVCVFLGQGDRGEG